jgi:hypothetical protein
MFKKRNYSPKEKKTVFSQDHFTIISRKEGREEVQRDR